MVYENSIKPLSLLGRVRLQYRPSLPPILQNLKQAIPIKMDLPALLPDPDMQKIFPHSLAKPCLTFQPGTPLLFSSPLKVAVVLSGGQAPGGHSVISGLFDALKALHKDSSLIGFLNGPSGILKNQWIELTEEKVSFFRNQGGFDLLGSGRTKIETLEQFQAAKETFQFHALDGLVIVGGDDSNTNAAFLAEFCHEQNIPTRIIGVPKTIDGDLKNSFIEISFGFDTATKVYSEIIGNLLKDSLSSKKYYFFIKMMGRSASHITLECALQTHVNLALIGEEIAKEKKSLQEIVQQIADLISERAEKGKEFGAILIPEGILEFIPECQEMLKELNKFNQANSSKESSQLEEVKQFLSPTALECFSLLPEEIQKQMLLERDPHGNIQLSKIETERLLITLVEKELTRRSFKGKFNSQPFFCGYEGRSAMPTNFDCNYCYALGHLAALLILHQASGYMCCIKNLTKPVEKWEVLGVPIAHMLHFETRKNKKQAVIQKALVNLESAAFKAFKEAREAWKFNDLYCCPGPIQFEGPKELTDSSPLTLFIDSK